MATTQTASPAPRFVVNHGFGRGVGSAPTPKRVDDSVDGLTARIRCANVRGNIPLALALAEQLLRTLENLEH